MKINIVNYFNEETYDSVIESVLQAGSQIHQLEQNEISIILCDNAYIQELNKTYRDKDYATDVLTFNDGEDGYLGDIFVSIEKVEEQRIMLGHGFDRELGFLVCHGLLHTLDYDHMNKEDEAVMIEKQNEIMEKAKLYR
jgi:probable rRNA maturation factor